jgi:hypothetical protein
MSAIATGSRNAMGRRRTHPTLGEQMSTTSSTRGLWRPRNVAGALAGLALAARAIAFSLSGPVSWGDEG